MPNSPKDNEEKLNRILNTWKTLALAQSFGGKTFAEFEAGTQPSFTTRQQLDDLDAQRTQVLNARDDADASSLNLAQMVVAGVVGDPMVRPPDKRCQIW